MSMDYEGYKQLWYVEVVHALPIFLRNSLRLIHELHLGKCSTHAAQSEYLLLVRFDECARIFLVQLICFNCQ